jgi:hypothetical protein
LGTGEVVGISIGIIFAIIVVAIGAVCFYRRLKKKDIVQRRKMEMMMTISPSTSTFRDSPLAALGRGRKLLSSTTTKTTTPTIPLKISSNLNEHREIPNLIFEPYGTITSSRTPPRRSDKHMDTFSAVNPMNN